MRFLLSALVCLLLLSQPIRAAVNPVLENANRQLDLLEPTSLEDKETRNLYLQIVETYTQIEVTQSEIEFFKKSLQTLPGDTSELKRQLGKEQRKKPAIKIKDTALQALELELTQLRSTQLELQQNRNKIENEINSYRKKPATLRTTLANLKQLEAKSDNATRTDIQQQLDDASFSLNNLKIQSINLELLVIPLNSEYDRLKLNWLDIELLNLKEKTRVYQDKIQQVRQTDTDKLLEEISPSSNSKNNPLAIEKLIEKNAELSEQLRSSVTHSSASVDKLRILEQQYTLIQQSYKVIQQQLELSENSFGIELKNFSQRFSAPIVTEDTNTQISKIRLLKIELNQLKLNMTINRPNTSAWTKESIADLQDVQNATLDLINNLHTAYTRELDELSKIFTLEKQIEKQFKLGQKLLTEYLLWLPSVPTIDSNWLSQISNSVKMVVADAIYTLNHLKVRAMDLWLRWIVVLLLFLGIAIFLLQYQKRHEKRWSQQIGNVIHDRFSRSLKLVVLAPIISFPAPLALYILNNKIFENTDAAIQMINDLFCLFLWFFLSFIIWLKRPYGLFISHLDIPEDFCIKLKKILLPLCFFGAPTTWLLLYYNTIASLELHSGLGRLTFIFLAVLAGMFWAALWKVSPHVNHADQNISWWQQAKLWLFTLVILHALLIIAALLGYLFTSSIVMSVLLAFTILFYAVFALYRLGVRWLLIAERRISFAKAKARRTEILAAREKNEEVPPLEEDYLGLKSVSEQASVLLKALSFGLLFITSWLLVKNFLPSLDVLDKVVLWSNDVITVSGVISESVTLLSVITSLFIIGLTIVAAYNLPGLLELLVLRHIKLTQGTSYAVTTITRYLLIIISIMVGASQFGVEWAKLQWLVAALGVGLGFGLQEIVANFVSGIIILFEKPVRIGDTITIGGVTGKVTKIKIRATTIADWDRKEVIIPNKTFVTDQLINWSLSDAITRVIIKVGVAYGSETELVHRLILNAAGANYRVLQTPEPEVFFTTFGNSTLDFELRFYVNNLSDRNLAIHEINQQIDHSFREQNVSIAFPQLDVHLHRTKPG